VIFNIQLKDHMCGSMLKWAVAANSVRHQFSDIELVVDKAIANIPEIYEAVVVDRRSMANTVRRYESPLRVVFIRP